MRCRCSRASLPAIKRDPADMTARLDAQLGMWLSRFVTMAGIPYGASHGLGYLLGAYKGVPHGITSCLTLPAVLAWNEPVNADRQRAVAAAFGRPGESASAGVRSFVESLGLADAARPGRHRPGRPAGDRRFLGRRRPLERQPAAGERHEGPRRDPRARALIRTTTWRVRSDGQHARVPIGSFVRT